MEQQTYYRDEADDVKGFVVIETGDEGYRVAEQRNGEWVKPFWMPESELRERIESGSANRAGKLSSDQYLRVCEEVGVA